jgi:Spy/CpxP family protein refolding chaperone
VDRLLEELQLSPAQRATVDQLMSDRRDRLEQFYQDVQTRFEAEQRDLRAAIRAALTPEQQQRFDEWVGRQPPPPGLLGGPRGRRGGPPPGRDGRN